MQKEHKLNRVKQITRNKNNTKRLVHLYDGLPEIFKKIIKKII